MKIGIFGTGAYGLALASVIINNRLEVEMWTAFEEEKEKLQITRKNDLLLPNYILPTNVKITTSVEECMKDKDLIIIAIPVAFIDKLCSQIRNYITDNQHICVASKGIEQSTGLFVYDIIKKHINTEKIAIISGPSFAKDMIEKKPMGLSLATTSLETKDLVNKILANDYIKLRYTDDIIGVEICGSIKNVIAIAAGMIDGLDTNSSTKAMLITESIHDIEEIIRVFNGKEDTVLSYAGFGDLLLTCTSNNSRNYTLGKMIGQGVDENIINKYLRENTVEGYYTLESIYELLHDKKVTVPIIDLIHNIVKKKDNPSSLLTFLIEKE